MTSFLVLGLLFVAFYSWWLSREARKPDEPEVVLEFRQPSHVTVVRPEDVEAS